MNDGRIIGVDHGYAAMKTANFIFPTGLAAYDYPPYTLKDTLEYDGKYYVIGNERQRLQRDKTLTDDSYLMTLAAIAKEIELRNLDRVLDVHLAAGLPLTGYATFFVMPKGSGENAQMTAFSPLAMCHSA